MIKRGVDIKTPTLEEVVAEYWRNIPTYFTPVKIAAIKNGCCRKLPVIVTMNEREDGTQNYSCQCACGGWCTTGCDTIEEAIRHYERMTAGENLYGRFDDFEI